MLDLAEVLATETDFRQAVQGAVPFRPIYVKIKLTWLCNLRCKMCNVWRQSRENRLTLPVIRSLAGELAALGTRKVHLSGGEVLMRPDIFEVVAAFADRQIQVNLTTNGTMLTPERAAALVESGVHNVSISLDGATPAVHDDLRGKGNWKRTIRGIRNLRRAAKHGRRKLHIRINFVVTRRNFQDAGGLPEIAHQAGADRLTLIPVDDGDGRMRLNKSRIRTFNEEVAPFLADRALAYGMIAQASEAYPFGREKQAVELSKSGLYARGLYETQPCYMPWLHAMIGPRGEVFPCCMLRSTRHFGKFTGGKQFRKVWAGSAFREFRRQMLLPGERPATCRSCDDFLEENRFLHGICGPSLPGPESVASSLSEKE